MPRRQRLVFLLFCSALLLTIGRLATGSFTFVLADFWFTAGLLLLVLLSVVDQPHFSTDSNIFLNGLAALLSLIGVAPNHRSNAWTFFLIWALYLVASSYFLMLRRSASLAHESPIVQVLSRVNRTIGRPQAIFSAFFLWGIGTRFSEGSTDYAALMWFWAVFMILDLPAVSTTISGWLEKLGAIRSPSVGSLTGFVSPRIVEAELTANAPSVAIGREVEIITSAGTPCATAIVIDDRIMAGSRRIRMGIKEVTSQWSQLATQTRNPAGLRFLPSAVSADIPISVVDVGTDITTLRMSIPPATSLVDGELIWTLLPDGTRAHYQIVDAKITENAVGSDHGIHQLAVAAAQLGRWEDDGARFEPVGWVSPPGGMVFKAGIGAIHPPTPAGHIKIGTVPRASFPVHLSIEDAVTHNTAILGVTGSGKSFLCLHLIFGLLVAGVKVLVLDITRQYWPVLEPRHPTALHNLGELEAWLKSEKLLALYQFADSLNFTRSTAEYVDKAFNYLKESIKLRPGTNEPPHLCIVFEEAHSLIPEWNQVSEKYDSDNVNRTSRAILQGRKYGLGCIVVSQRTANVTKTILNQCNTIAAFQCFDQTGLEFLANPWALSTRDRFRTCPRVRPS